MTSMFHSQKPSSRRSHTAFKNDVVNVPSIAPAKVQPALTAEQLEDILRKFDLNPRYGPFVGIDRMERWERANRFGLAPPPAVRKLLAAEGAVSQRQGGMLW